MDQVLLGVSFPVCTDGATGVQGEEPSVLVAQLCSTNAEQGLGPHPPGQGGFSSTRTRLSAER